METTSAKALKILESENPVPYKIVPYMNHLVIEITEANESFDSLFTKIQTAVTSCIKQKFHDQDDNILFDVRHADNERSFRVYK